MRTKIKAPMNVFQRGYKVPPVKTVNEPLVLPSEVRVRISRPCSRGGSGWLALGFGDCPTVASTPHIFTSPSKAVAKLSEFKQYLGAEIKFL